jgi:hypothetical protein
MNALPVKSVKIPLTGMLTLLLCAAVLVSAGCSRSATKQYIRPGIDSSSIRTVAVLPFQNLTQENHAGEKIRSKVGIELLSRGIDVVEPGEISFAMKELKIRSVSSLRSEHIVNLGEMLGADKIITGSLESFGISPGVNVSYPEVSVHLVMHETATGRIVWSMWHTSGGASFMTRHFGAEGMTLDDLSEEVIEEAFSAFLHDWKPVFTKQQSPSEMLKRADLPGKTSPPAPARDLSKEISSEAPDKVEVKIQFAPAQEEPALSGGSVEETGDTQPSQEAEQKETLPTLGSIMPDLTVGTNEHLVYINEMQKEN